MFDMLVWTGLLNITLPSGCSAYFGWLRVWMIDAPGFTDFSTGWNTLSYEYSSCRPKRYKCHIREVRTLSVPHGEWPFAGLHNRRGFTA